MESSLHSVTLRQASPLPFTRVSGRKRSAFYTQLGRMLEAGIAPVRALQTLGAQRFSWRLARAARDMGIHIQAGGMLASALARHPNLFPANEVRMVEASERAGAQAETLLRIAKHLDRLTAFWRKLITGLIYPGFLVFAAVVVVPLVIAVLVGDPVALLRRQAVGAAGGLGVALVAITLWRSFSAVGPVRALLHGVVLGLPGFGAVARRMATARFADTLQCLYAAGVPTPEALSRAAMACGNAVLGRRVLRAVPRVHSGESLTAALAPSGALPPMVVSMIAVGEEAGKLDEALLRIAEQEHFDAQVGLDRLVKILEQVAIFLVIGLVVLMIFAQLAALAQLYRQALH